MDGINYFYIPFNFFVNQFITFSGILPALSIKEITIYWVNERVPKEVILSTSSPHVGNRSYFWHIENYCFTWVAKLKVSATLNPERVEPGYILQFTSRSRLYLKKYSQASCQFMLALANMNKYIVFTFYYILLRLPLLSWTQA